MIHCCILIAFKNCLIKIDQKFYVLYSVYRSYLCLVMLLLYVIYCLDPFCAGLGICGDVAGRPGVRI